MFENPVLDVDGSIPHFTWIPSNDRPSDASSSCLAQVKAYGTVSYSGDGKPDSLHIEMATNASREMMMKFKQLENVTRNKYIYVIDCDNKGPESQHARMISNKIKIVILGQTIQSKNVVLSWCGLKTWPGSVMHNALRDMRTNTMQKQMKVLGGKRKEIFSLAYLSWNDVDADLKGQLERHGVADTSVCDATEKSPLGDNVSPYLTHFVLLSAGDREWRDVYSQVLRHMANNLPRKPLTIVNDLKELEPPETQACVVCVDGGDVSNEITTSLCRKLPVFIIEDIKACSLWYDIYAGTNSIKLRDIFESLAKLIFDCSYDEITFFDLFSCQPSAKILICDWLFSIRVLRDFDQTEVSKDKERLHDPLKDSNEFSFYIFIAVLIHEQFEYVDRFLKEFSAPDRRVWEHLDVKTLLLLYNTDKVKKISRKKRDVVFLDEIREIQENILQKQMTVIPLRCAGRECHCCRDYRKAWRLGQRETYKMRSCLHPKQELFIWFLITGQRQSALSLWKTFSNKIAGAIMAKTILTAVSLCRSVEEEMEKEHDIEWAGRFQRLTIMILNECNEKYISTLLINRTLWWGGLSVLQLAFESGNKEFMAQPACKRQMINIWRDGNCDMVPEKKERWGPVHRYRFNLILQLIFLAMFTEVMLFQDGRHLTISFLFVIGWMVITTLEEMRQMLAPLMTTPGHDNDVHGRGLIRPICLRLKRYFRDFWNITDVVIMVMFWFGMLNFSSDESIHIGGRILLSLDICLAYLRMFQMLMVFEKLGLMLVMVGEMLKGTVFFMIILLVAVISYAVASEAILYPESKRTATSLFYLPRKAYWQVFGELFLDDIEGIGVKGCIFGHNTSQNTNDDMSQCPSQHGRYVVQVLLGVYIVFTNVLLLNLLIAQFNQTYNQVLDEASETQFWHKCKLIVEYKYVVTIPPPLNLIESIFKLCRFCCCKLCHLCCCKLCRFCCCKLCCFCCCKLCYSKRETSQSKLSGQAERSHDGTCLQVCMKGLKPAKFSKRRNGFFVHVNKYALYAAHPSSTYSIFTNQHSKYTLIWDLEPYDKYSIKVTCGNADVRHDDDVKILRGNAVVKPEDEIMILHKKTGITPEDSVKKTHGMQEDMGVFLGSNLYNVTVAMEENKAGNRVIEKYMREDWKTVSKKDKRLFDLIENVVSNQLQCKLDVVSNQLQCRLDVVSKQLQKFEEDFKSNIDEINKTLREVLLDLHERNKRGDT